MFFKCLSFMALNWSALNQPGNITSHSRARCSLGHLGVGLGWQTFCSRPVEKISALRNNTHHSRALRHVGGSLYGSALNQLGNITTHSYARCSLRPLGVGLGGLNFFVPTLWRRQRMSPTLLSSVFPNERWFISPVSNGGIAYLYLCLYLDFPVLYDFSSPE